MRNILNSLNDITPRKRVELALQKKLIDKVPFTLYGTYWGRPSIENPVMPFGKYFPQSTMERWVNYSTIVDTIERKFNIHDSSC